MVENKLKDSPRIKALKYKTRRESIKEGILATGRYSFGDHYASPFAIAINASNSVVALLSAITGIVGPMSQLLGSKLMEKHSRKKIVRRSVLLESLSWIPIIIVGLLYYFNIIVNILPLAFLIFFGIFSIFMNLSMPAWFSWIGDLINSRYRGRWIAKRNLITGFSTAVFAISSAFFLEYMKNLEKTALGFVAIFTLAMIFRLSCLKTFKKHYEPKIKIEKQKQKSIWEFLVNLPKSNYGKFLIFRGFFAFAISITSPLVAVYLLRNLEFGYPLYVTITIAGAVLSLLFIELWGKISDKFGSHKVIMLSTLIVPITPILWILSKNPIYLILVPSAIGGIAWSGFVLGAQNFVYESASPEKVGEDMAYYHIVVGMGIFLGASLGALLIKYINISLIEPIVAIFILGSIVRMFSVYVFLPKVKDTKKSKVSSRGLKNLIMHQLRPTISHEAHQIIGIGKYLR